MLRMLLKLLLHLHVDLVSVKMLDADLELDVEAIPKATLPWLCRVYPKGVRVGSDNMDPLPVWGAGMQMVALNYQTNDLPMQINRALFDLAGENGYSQPPPPPFTFPCSTLVLHARVIPVW